jgi:hypothetical protein
MKWANFLHIYQPENQQPDILEAIVVQSYRPILRGLKSSKKVHITLNISGVLLELFDKYGYRDLIDDLRELIKAGRLEITGSAKYHAILPFLSEKEIIRQIEINTDTLRHFFGPQYTPQGFFPPEMAYDQRLPKIIEKLGFKWIILDEIAKTGKTQTIDFNTMYEIEGTKILAFFRERRPSNLIMSAMVRSYKTLQEAMKESFSSGRYLITGMDGETFGHHRPGLENLLFEILNSDEYESVKISDLPIFYTKKEKVTPVSSTWASSEEDIERGVQFLSWKDPDNKIHAWQWELVNLALQSTYSLSPDDSEYADVRNRMDEALASDHFWWASAKPWWSLEEIERGAYMCLDIIRRISSVSSENLSRANKLYENIISTAFEWKRSGKIYQMAKQRENIIRIPFQERTLEKGGVEKGIYEAFMDMFANLENEAVKNQEYEKAILWRDAIYKIKNKTDMYDAVNAIELLRTKIPNVEIEATLDKYTEKYKKIRGGQPEQRGS